MRNRLLGFAAILAAGTSLAVAQVKINACGATFPEVVYQKWFSDYRNVHSDVQVNYNANGSGGGVKGVTDGTVDFGASDMPMTDKELAAVKGKILHFPTVLGAVVPIYNLPGISADLKFSGPVLASIFMGKITKWNDKQIAADNAGVNLPATDISVVHRTDGSGTTFIFTDFLSKVSPDWKSKVSAAKSVSWPTGIGASGNAGVTGMVKQTPGSIGYVELIYAVQNKLGYGLVKNAAGEFVKATMASVSQAAAGVPMPDDFRVSITDATGKGAYPISSFTWLLIPEKISDAAKSKQIHNFLAWMLTEGQKSAPTLAFASLPKPVIEKEQKMLATLEPSLAVPAKSAPATPKKK